MINRSRAIATNIAARIARNKTRKRFSSLYDEALREINMSETLPHVTPVGSPADGKKMAAEPSSDSLNSGFTVGSQVSPVVVKQVDHNALVGSNQGDHRSPNTGAGVTDFAKNAPGPRDQVRQAPLSGKQASTPAPKNFLGAEGSDQN
jgi:hypothetical protein